jgi:putative aldouronate transport system substrate-binding protein
MEEYMRKFTVLNVVLLLSLILGACTTTQATPAKETVVVKETQIVKETQVVKETQKVEVVVTATPVPEVVVPPVTVKIFAPQAAERDMATNTFSLLLEKKFNVKFEWTTTTYDGTSAREKRNLALASGDYPDLFMLIPWIDQFSPVDLLKYGQQGVLVPLNDLIDQYAPNIKAALGKYPDFKGMTVSPDGTIWGLPQLIQCYHCSYGNKYWINTKWLKKLNLEMPKTTEEFKAVLEAFKTKDPNGNGKADEVPLSGAIMDYGTRPIPFLMDGFIYDDDRTYLILNNGKVETIANKPEYKEGLAYVKGLYDAGLIDPGAFTNNAEAYSALGNNADAELLGVGAGMHPAIFVSSFGDASAKPYAYDYDPLPPLQGPHAAFSTILTSMVPGATFVLTNKASKEVQIAAIKMVEYMFTFEGHMNGIFGVKDVDWRDPLPGETANNLNVKPLYFDIPLGPGETDPNRFWGAGAQYFDDVAIRDAWVQSTNIYSDEGYEHRLLLATDLYNGKQDPNLFPFWAVWPDPTVADEQALLKTNITDYINTNALAFVTGSKSLDKDWDAYVKGLDNLGLARYLEINQKTYDASKK